MTIDKETTTARAGTALHDKITKAMDLICETFDLNGINAQVGGSAMITLLVKNYKDHSITKHLFLSTCEEAWDIEGQEE